MKKIKFTEKHILLLLLYSPTALGPINVPINGRTRLMKMMFLFNKEIQKDFLKDSSINLISFPEFISWFYGPFAKEIYNDIEFFINNGFINIKYLDTEKEIFEIDEYDNWLEEYLFDGEENFIAEQEKEECFQLSEKATRFVKDRIYVHLSENQKNIIKKFKKQLIESSLDAIIRYTYLKYPEYTNKSKIRGKVFG